MTPGRIRALAVGLLVAAIASAVAPKHSVYNPPGIPGMLGVGALLATIWAHEAAKHPTKALRDLNDIEFVVSFDDRVISLAYPDGSTDSARWADLESVAIVPDADPDCWVGPYFILLAFRDSRLAVPAWSRGRDALLERLLDLPAADRDRLEALLGGGLSALKGRLLDLPGIDRDLSMGGGQPPWRCVLWARDKGA